MPSAALFFMSYEGTKSVLLPLLHAPNEPSAQAGLDAASCSAAAGDDRDTTLEGTVAYGTPFVHMFAASVGRFASPCVYGYMCD